VNTLTAPTGTFDYSALEPEIAEALRNQTARIREGLRNTVNNIIEIGRDLLAARGQLEHGHFGKWVEAEFPFTLRTAQNYMNAARLEAESETVSLLPEKIVRLIAAKSTPPEIRDQVLASAAAGETIKPKAVEDRLKRARLLRKEENREAQRKQKRSTALKRRRDAQAEKYRQEFEEAEKKRWADNRVAALDIIARYGEDGAEFLVAVPNIWAVLDVVKAELATRRAVQLEAT
jgi:hypothetical protein